MKKSLIAGLLISGLVAIAQAEERFECVLSTEAAPTRTKAELRITRTNGNSSHIEPRPIVVEEEEAQIQARKNSRNAQRAELDRQDAFDNKILDAIRIGKERR